jgi:hypothetical protein
MRRHQAHLVPQRAQLACPKVGNDPAIHHLEIASRFDQLTDDLVECWITFSWAAQACMSAIRREPNLGCLLV